MEQQKHRNATKTNPNIQKMTAQVNFYKQNIKLG